MEHNDEVTVQAAALNDKQILDPDLSNQLKRRISGDSDCEKRLREEDDGDGVPAPPEALIASPGGDTDPQMQVSSLESDYNDPPIAPDPPSSAGVVPNEAENLPPPSTDYDFSTKLQEMDEISVQAVTKAEAMKHSSEAADQDAVDEVSLTKRVKEDESADDKKKNVSNLRKNIRDVIDDTMLDASTLAAQREEQERLNRVQEQQRALRALHRQTDLDKRQSSILSLLQGTLDPTDDPMAAPAVSIAAVRVLDKKTGQVLEEIPDQQGLEPGEIPNPALAAVQLKEAQQILEKGGITATSTAAPAEKKEVVEINDSSDDDCIMLSDEEEEPDGDDDPHNSGLHVNDTYNLPDDEGRVLVNFGHSDTESDVFVAPQIARALKPHQIGGVRFLYDNIIESLDRFDSSTGFGCILAHSMGLGKTLQLVCFCDIFLRHTSAKTVLCIMPINTLQNWLAEFNWWLPEDEHKSPLREFGPVRGRNFKIHVLNDSQKTIAARSKVVLNWAKAGGVLLIGYELYRLLCLKKVVKKRGKRAERDPVYAEKEQAAHGELLEEIYGALVKPGPDLVVCDEGHRIKSSHASTSVALKQIRTKRRVVLTGYPLQNNLLEYWCMVDFVRPNYLGTKTEFTNMFEKPIQNGQCIDSTPQDIKLMRYRAHVLHSLLLGFVQRRSHLVLQSTLPNKLEYVMLVRMTTFQRKLYDVFMNEVVRKKAVPNPLKAFAVCCKIWNHPDVLYNFLKKREADLDLELEEEMALAEAKRVRKEKEKKVKQEREEEEEKVKKEKEEEVERQKRQNGIKLEATRPEGVVSKMESQLAGSYQNSSAVNSNQYGQNSNSSTSSGLNSFGGGYGSSTDSLHQHPPPGAVTYDPYGNVNSASYYSQPYGSSNPNSYQSGQPAHLAYGGHNHHHHHQQQQQQQLQQYYSNDQGGANEATKDKLSYWGNQQQYGSNGYYDQTANQQYTQDYNMTTAPPPPLPPTGSNTNVGSDIPTTVSESTSVVKDESSLAEELEEKKKKRKKSESSSPEKETKSSRDDGIPYEWAVELMKDYVPDLLENAPKMEIFFCILNESMAVGDRILVFSQSLLTLNLIERYLQRERVPRKEHCWAKNTNYFRLDGSTTACDRERLINEFNTNEEVAIFLVSTRAGSLGINLVGANRVIVFDASWNPCHDTQAVCRVYRYGQKKQCYVYRMVMDNCLEKRIYDRQVNKQGMSDRVVDECNPDAHLSIKEVTNLCWDNDEETEVKDFSGLKEQYPDVVMHKVLERYSTSLSKEPFRHESLLVDRKEKKLSMAEKRLAQRGYELEKQASTKPAYNNSYPGKVTQYRVFRTADGSLVHRAVGAVQSLNSSGVSSTPSSGGKWIPAEVWRQQGMTTQETTLPADVTIPSNSGDKNAGIVLKAGQKVMILKSSKGVYMQLETGKIIAIRTGPKANPANQAPMNIPRPRGFGDANEVIKLDDDDEDDDGDDSESEGEVKKEKKVTAGNGNTLKMSDAGKPRGGGGLVKVEGSSSGDGPNKHNSTLPTKSTDPHPLGSSGAGGYYDTGSSFANYNASGYRQQQQQYEGAGGGGGGSAKGAAVAAAVATNRDYNSYQGGGYADGRGDYQQQKAYNPSNSSSSNSSSSGTTQVAGGGTATVPTNHNQGYAGASSGSSYGSLYGTGTTSSDPLPNNGQYVGGGGGGQHRAPVPTAYPPQGGGYDYSNRYFDQQSKAVLAASQFNHYPPAPSALGTPSAGGGYGMGQSAYPNAAYHHQYGQHRAPTMPGEYNPNNPPYYMNPYAAGAAASSSAAGMAAYHQYDQSAVAGAGQPEMEQELLQSQQAAYSDSTNATGYGQQQQYGNQYMNGPTTTGQPGAQLGKVEAPVTATAATDHTQTHKKKESGRRKAGESAFHKPSAAEGSVVEVKAAEKETATTPAVPPNNNYYDRTTSGSYGPFASPYSPYNYPPSAYFYPGSYCAPSPLPEPSTVSSASAAAGRQNKEGKSRSSDAAKYYDLSRTTAPHYQPPKW